MSLNSPGVGEDSSLKSKNQTPVIRASEPVEGPSSMGWPYLGNAPTIEQMEAGDIGSFMFLQQESPGTAAATVGSTALIGPRLEPNVDGVSRFAISTFTRTSGVTVTLRFSQNVFFGAGEPIIIQGLESFGVPDKTVVIINSANARSLSFNNSGTTIAETGVSNAYVHRRWSNSSLNGVRHVIPTSPVPAMPQQGAAWIWRPDSRSVVNASGNGFAWNTPKMVTFRSRTSNVATLTFAAAHGFVVDQYITVLNVLGSGYDSVANTVGWRHVRVTSVPTSTTLTYDSTGADEATTAVTKGAVSPSIMPSITTPDADLVDIAYTAGYHCRVDRGAGNPTGLSLKYGSFSATVLAFFVGSMTITALPETGRYLVFGQFTNGYGLPYGYGVRISSTGQLAFVTIGDVSWPGTVIATSAATVTAGETVHLSKFGNEWTFGITAATYGPPKANSMTTVWKRVGATLGYSDIFGETVVGFCTDSVNGRMDQPRFVGGG